jgi:hypothetical protein
MGPARFIIYDRSARWDRNGFDSRRAANMDAESRNDYSDSACKWVSTAPAKFAEIDVTPIVKAICEAAKRGPASPSDLIDRGLVEWRGNDEIRVRHANLIPNVGPKDTISGRRKRLREKLKSEMTAIGWEQVSVRQWITFKRH